jgi:hypothetical protein
MYSDKSIAEVVATLTDPSESCSWGTTKKAADIIVYLQNELKATADLLDKYLEDAYKYRSLCD